MKPIAVTGNSRYPGTSPFADDTLSRKTFFGRSEESRTLANQISANRLVLVYAKSGVGKTSLLKAGVMHRLRAEGYLPFVVRLNIKEEDPVEVVEAALRIEAQRKNIEMETENVQNLWEFFKTVELWDEDTLLTPIMIIDQFEELFTIQEHDFRTLFIEELSAVTRKYPPKSDSISEEIKKKLHNIASPPPLRIVLAVREDFLGVLEEAAETIPQIFSCRFRLAPLSAEKARDALKEPAELKDESFYTRPFEIQDSAIDDIIESLSKQIQREEFGQAVHVEPFQLQLICIRIEEIAFQKQHKPKKQLPIKKQKKKTDNIQISTEDLGYSSGIMDILKDFYSKVLQKIPKARKRRAVRRLCESALITDSGRRNSIGKEQIVNKFKISPEILALLVKERLLRTDQRANETFYELSHDSLVKPVLTSRQLSSSLKERLRIVGGVLIGCIGVIFGLFMIILGITSIDDTGVGILGASFMFIFSAVLLFGAYYGFKIFKSGRSGLKRLKLADL